MYIPVLESLKLPCKTHCLKMLKSISHVKVVAINPNHFTTQVKRQVVSSQIETT